MRTIVFLSCFAAASTCFAADPTESMERFLAVWSSNGRVTRAAVDRFYADRVVYYGSAMTAQGVYEDKQRFIRRWPDRRYRVVPGSVGSTCAPGRDRCRVTAVLSWDRAGSSGRGGARGANSLELMLARQHGVLKIVRESGSPIALSACRGQGRGRLCTAYR